MLPYWHLQEKKQQMNIIHAFAPVILLQWLFLVHGTIEFDLYLQVEKPNPLIHDIAETLKVTFSKRFRKDEQWTKACQSSYQECVTISFCTQTHIYLSLIITCINNIIKTIFHKWKHRLIKPLLKLLKREMSYVSLKLTWAHFLFYINLMGRWGG